MKLLVESKLRKHMIARAEQAYRDQCAVSDNWRIRALLAEAKLDAVETEVKKCPHRYTTSQEAYRNIRSIVQALRKALEEVM